jgi:hypothetical protein
MNTTIERVITPIANSVTPDFARRLIELTPDPVVEARLEELAEKNTAGDLTTEERAEYESLVMAGDLISILRACAYAVLQ